MQRYFSGGVTTLVALMAAHRTAVARGEAGINPAEIARIESDLRSSEPPPYPTRAARSRRAVPIGPLAVDHSPQSGINR